MGMLRDKLEWWVYKYRLKFGYKLRFRFTRRQRQALTEKIPMTKELFWGCLDVYYLRHDMPHFWEIWNKYPQFIKEWNDEFDRDMEDPTSKRRQEHDIWWKNMRQRLIDAMGEDWVKENCKE